MEGPENRTIPDSPTSLLPFARSLARPPRPGLTPQSISVLGGFRSLGKSAKEAEEVYDQALRLQDAGCFSVVLECIPSELAAAITHELEIPTIGIGSGPGTSGQVLVYHDMLGMLSHPHHESVTPRFAKR